jgi:hypothetical protein
MSASVPRSGEAVQGGAAAERRFGSEFVGSDLGEAFRFPERGQGKAYGGS